MEPHGGSSEQAVVKLTITPKIYALLAGAKNLWTGKLATSEAVPAKVAAWLNTGSWRIAILWTLLVLALAAWRCHSDWISTWLVAKNLAEESYRKDILYRRWATLHGGVYAPATEQTPPNPYLDVPERDLITPSGKALTLINPAYMTRQVHELGAATYGVRSHITSLNPIRPGNAPDEWERQALLAFEQGQKEVVSLETLDGEPYLRFMRPMITEKGCLKCHAAQGYREGDIRGGISASVPWQPYRQALLGQVTATVAGYGTIWGLGLLGLMWLHRQLREYFADRQRAETALRQSEEKFAKIFQSTPDVVVISRVSDGLLLEVNPGFEAITGYTRAEAVGRSTLDLQLWADPLDRERMVTELRLYSQVLYRDFTFRRKDGALRTGQFSIRPITVEDEPCLLFVMQDITERKRAEAALRTSEERLRDIANSVPGVVYQFYARPTGELGLYYISERADELFGLGNHLEDAFARFTTYVAPEDREAFLASIQQAVATVRPWDFEGRFIKPTGEVIWFKGVSSPMQLAHELVFTGIILDITERKRAEAALRESEERYRLLFERANDAIFIVEKQTGRYLDANRAAECLTGRTVAELKTLRTADLTPANAPKRLRLAAETTEALELGEVVYLRPDGVTRTALLSVIPVNEEIMFGIARDITEIKEAEQRIEHLAYYDALTGLPNRVLLAQRAELALALAARHRTELAVLFLDLDRFKEVNDSLGHTEGDTLLVQVAARLRALTRAEDTVCRLGGDEFVLLLSEASQDGALRVADKLLAAFRQSFMVAGHSLSVTVSIGIALYPHDGVNFTELLKNADAALYRAKHDGRNTRAFYAREMNVATFERLMLESELRQAIQTSQLRAYFQPKICLMDGRPVGAEALMRWQHPDHGLILPGRFIPMAEASDLVVALGDWMLAEVCRQLAAWRRAGMPPLTVAVNLAARHFRELRLPDRVHGLLEAYGLPPQSLELEITESSLLETDAQTVETLLALKRLNVGLAIDDFGTGYSSLGYLKRLPLVALKIDRSFVRDLVTDPDDRTLAATIIALGHSLGLKVVAEGVETEEQRRILLDQGCDLAQGYLFSYPLPADEFAGWLARANTP
ncbi:MAG: EAL domain-containing protein [Candidatus Competibacteraceae bacterium]